jgi:hypothetical protein
VTLGEKRSHNCGFFCWRGLKSLCPETSYKDTVVWLRPHQNFQSSKSIEILSYSGRPMKRGSNIINWSWIKELMAILRVKISNFHKVECSTKCFLSLNFGRPYLCNNSSYSNNLFSGKLPL